jgi:septal ring factor EnvC (AmiA/AmiB activator)
MSSIILMPEDDESKSSKFERLLFFQQKRNEELEASHAELKSQLDFLKLNLAKVQGKKKRKSKERGEERPSSCDSDLPSSLHHQREGI